MSNATKNCSTCHQHKAMSEFNVKTAARDGRQPKCRECTREYKARWKAENREEILRKARDAYRANPEKVKQYQKMRRAQDPDAWRARYAKYTRDWRAANPENAERSRAASARWARSARGRLNKAAHERKRRAKAMASSGVSVDQIQARISYYGGRCWMCGDAATTIDHVKPLAKGGLHLASNLRPACRPCNIRKHARWYGVARIDELKDWVLLRLAA